MRSPRSLLVTLASLVVAAAACGGTTGSSGLVRAPEPPPPGVTGEPGAVSGADDVRAASLDEIETVVMVGDSITVGSTPALQARFESMGMAPVLIDAQNGRRMVVSGGDIRSGTRVIEALLSEPAATDSVDALDDDHGNEVWVVALGTNDVAQYGSPDEVAAAVNEVLALVPDEAPLVWVDTYFEGRPDQAAALNAVVADRIERRGNAVMAPWSVFAPTDGTMTGDGVHPTVAGQEVFAFVVADTVQAFLAG